MRHGSTLALVASCWLTLSPGSDRVEAGSGPAPAPSPAPGPTESWILPDWSQGFRVAPILLLSRDDVRADLRLKPEQVADAARVITDARQKANQLMGRTDSAAIDLRRSVDEEQRLWLETRLTEDQVERLSQIDLRWEGKAAIATRPGVAELLSLSIDQKAALKQALDDRNRHRARPADRERDPAAIEHQFVQQVWSTLNDGQHRRWEKMIGRPFAVVASTSGRSPR